MKKTYRVGKNTVQDICYQIIDYVYNTKAKNPFTLTLTNEKKRSTELNDRFRGHLRAFWQELCTMTGRDYDYKFVYWKVLHRACSYKQDSIPEGYTLYPYYTVNDNLIPKGTSECTNNELMTACLALEEYALELGIALPEKVDG